jgi:hypothetical protein
MDGATETGSVAEKELQNAKTKIILWGIPPVSGPDIVDRVA